MSWSPKLRSYHTIREITGIFAFFQLKYYLYDMYSLCYLAKKGLEMYY